MTPTTERLSQNPPTDTIAFAFGQIQHKRFSPRVHEFAYRGFFLRVPVHALPRLSLGNGLFGLNRKALMSFHEQDHGDGKSPLYDWAQNLLREHNIVADGAVWLHTFARIAGYQFKPVSFWFCHNQAGALVAVIAEVNNTFGERHLYLLNDPHKTLAWGQTLKAQKAFHVSPFFQIEGRYEFRFLNNDSRTVARIDYKINNTLALHTSMSGRYFPVNTGTTLRALLAYPLFSLGVMVKIHWQALRLWTQKRIPFFTKPSPPKNLITRGDS
jgi:uncharacterized protein